MISIWLKDDYRTIVSDEDFDMSLAKLDVSISGFSQKPYVYVFGLGNKDENKKPLHIVIGMRKFGEIPEDMVVDHKDGDSLNNTRDNLRLATRQQDAMNRGPMPGNRTGYKGVSPDKSRYKAVISLNGTLRKLS